MRKIATQGEIERKERRGRIIIGAVLVVIMMLSTLGYAFFSGEREKERGKVEYNGIKFFEQENGGWVFELQGVQFYTQYNPEDTENISSVIFRTPADYGGKNLFFIGEGPARREIEYNLEGKIIPRSQDGCLLDYEDSCMNNTPIKNCSMDNVIIIKESEGIKISQEENCIFIESPYPEQARVADSFIFKILGIQ